MSRFLPPSRFSTLFSREHLPVVAALFQSALPPAILFIDNDDQFRMKAVILTISDKGSRGERVDTTGPALADWLRGHKVDVLHAVILPDDENQIAQNLADLADRDEADLVLTTGGTGVSPRDVTPDATTRVVERVLPGFGEAMRAAGREKRQTAIISRGVAGIRKRTLIINLPGSLSGALESLAAVWSAVPHAIEKLQGDANDCAV
jgi:molybdopterin adenylyltransferase